MFRREIIYQEGRPLPRQGSPLFITVVEVDEISEQITQESHVFMPGTYKHFSQIICRGLAGLKQDEVKEQCALTTYRLFVDYIRDHDRDAFVSLSDPYQPYQKVELASAPFGKLKDEPEFIKELEEIQEWTKSDELRRVIARALAPVAGVRVAETPVSTACFSRGGYDAAPAVIPGLDQGRRTWLD